MSFRPNGARPGPVPQKIPGADKFRNSAVFTKLKTYLPNVDQFLQETGSVIAGGSVLSAILNENWSNDIDMYVPIPHDKPILKELRETRLFSSIRLNQKASSYCTSFLKRNGIRTVSSFNQTPDSFTHLIDVMAVRKKTTPLQVVQNFDLTFCQVWYDGNDIWATHPEHILTKTGELQGDYVPIFLTGNRFLRNRMQKYLKRGFKVSADTQGKASTSALLNDFREECHRDARRHVQEDGVTWARKTIFRSLFGYNRYCYSNEYKLDEDGYDSDEYVESPEKLVEMAGSQARLAEMIYDYLYYMSTIFKVADEDVYADVKNRFLVPLHAEIDSLCGEDFEDLTGHSPAGAINRLIAENVQNNASNGSLRSENSAPNNQNNWENENTNTNTVNRPVERVPLPTESPTECFDPYMASMVDIADNQVLFYIYNAENQLDSVKCIDNETEENGRTLQLYRQFLDDNTYIYYKCKPSVPVGAIFVARNQVEPEPLRRLAFDKNIYVYESQAKKVQAGRKYALKPTADSLGRIVSESLLRTGDAVGAEHCQTNYEDRIYEIFEMTATGGVRKLRKKTRRVKRMAKRTKHSRRR